MDTQDNHSVCNTETELHSLSLGNKFPCSEQDNSNEIHVYVIDNNPESLNQRTIIDSHKQVGFF